MNTKSDSKEGQSQIGENVKGTKDGEFELKLMDKKSAFF